MEAEMRKIARDQSIATGFMAGLNLKLADDPQSGQQSGLHQSEPH